MIPKILHYCWFGGGNPLEPFEEYYSSWERYLPDWKFIRWDETNFDINSSEYTKFMHYNREYAFVADYVRMHALYNYGGFYLDTDVLLYKSLNTLLSHDLVLINEFFLKESDKFNWLNNAEIGCIKGHKLMKTLLEKADIFISNEYFPIESLISTIFHNLPELREQYNNTLYLHNGEFLLQEYHSPIKGVYGDHFGQRRWSTAPTYENLIILTDKPIPEDLSFQYITANKVLEGELVDQPIKYKRIKQYFIRVLPATRIMLTILHPKMNNTTTLNKLGIHKWKVIDTPTGDSWNIKYVREDSVLK